MMDEHEKNDRATAARIEAEIADSFDEELEMEMDDGRLARLLDGEDRDKDAGLLDRQFYFKELFRLQHELIKLQDWVVNTRSKVVVVFEGRDAAGKGGVIKRITQRLNPRVVRVVALSAPSERERSQWYFQRYVPHLPAGGEIVLFDRSWYNRAGVERVMGFCTEDQLAVFLREAPEFEGLLVRDGIKLFKFYLTIGREMQIKRFHERAQDPLKQWKLSPVDLAALGRYDDYTHAEIEMFRFTHTATAPWVVVRANDQRRARLETIRHVLLSIDYEGRDLNAIGRHDPLIIGSGPEFFHPHVTQPST